MSSTLPPHRIPALQAKPAARVEAAPVRLLWALPFADAPCT